MRAPPEMRTADDNSKFPSQALFTDGEADVCASNTFGIISGLTVLWVLGESGAHLQSILSETSCDQRE